MASSRFWAGSDDDSSEDASDASSVEEEKVKTANRWATVSDSESSDEGERVVKSAKDRAWDGMKAVIAKIGNSKKIGDWNGIQTEFENLNKMVDKAKMHIMKEGLPRFYVRTLAELEDFLFEALKDKEAQKKMSASNGRSLNRMKLTLRKHNKTYESQIAAYKADPDAPDAEDDAASSDDSSSDDDSSDDDSSDDDDSDDDSDASDRRVARPQGHGRARELLAALEALAGKAKRSFGYARELGALMHLIAAQFDANRTIDDYMDVATWRSCHGQLGRVVAVLSAHPGVSLGSIDDDDFADMHVAHALAKKKKGEDEEEEEDEKPEAAAAPNDDPDAVKVVGNLLTFLARLEDEYVKSLQRINPHTHEYVSRLRDEAPLTDLAAGVQAYYVRVGDDKAAATVALLRVEHMYYKHESIASAVRDAQAYRAKWGNRGDAHAASRHASVASERDSSKSHPGAWLGAATAAATAPDDEVVGDASASVRKLCEYVYAHGDDRCRTRALLCHVAHHALHGRFYVARDLLLMSHLQDTAYMSDVETQILYNRSMVMLGLCAFRNGLIHDAHACLAEICSSRVKELLAQGMQSARFSDKNPEQEKAERRRQTPYHMHINLDLLECCHLTAAMLLEVPNMSVEAGGAGGHKRPISRHFRKHLDIFNRQVFTGPPENTRDHVLCAAKALGVGDWKTCADLVLRLDVWALVPGAGEGDRVKAMIEDKIKAEALRTYLFAYSSAYDALSLPQLCDMFQLPKNVAHGLVSKMMINRELKGAWDQPTETIVLHRLEPSPLQALALHYADKAAALVESNERLLDARAGGHGYKDGDQQGRRWGDRDGGRGGRWNDRGGDRGDRRGGYGGDRAAAIGDRRGGYGDRRGDAATAATAATAAPTPTTKPATATTRTAARPPSAAGRRRPASAAPLPLPPRRSGGGVPHHRHDTPHTVAPPSPAR
ncbi:hypothetical protein JL720_2165 [Aureococcus anophagefferens]|nr:hypothetical protein JL720_2165 [Aureococcus anophagefferens]